MSTIADWLKSVFQVCRREFYLVSRDAGVLLFFLALPTVYPIAYTLIYNPEIVTDMPVAVVDNCRSAQSRDLARRIDATQAMKVAGYASDMGEARRWMDSHRVVAVFEIPSQFSQHLGRSEQATVPMYCDMSLLLRYRSILSAATDIQLATGAEIRAAKMEGMGLVSQTVEGVIGESPADQESIMLGDPTSGFASFVIPGILVLILQQSMLLGVVMLAGGSAERRRRNGGIDPLAINAPSGASILGKTACYLLIYIPLSLYALHMVPMMFALPHIGSVADYMMFITPMLVATSFLGLSIGVFFHGREESMPVIVFTSVLFLFLSGLTWPRYAMSAFWTAIGDLVPATWGVEGFIRLNSNGSTLAAQAHPYHMLWILAATYFLTAWLLNHYLRPRAQLRPEDARRS